MNDSPRLPSSVSRLKALYLFVAFIMIVFAVRLFYLQVIRHGYYDAQAKASQLKQYELPADRGELYAYDGGEIVPLVLNESRYRIVADPELVTDPEKAALELSEVLKIPAGELEELLTREGTRYVPLAQKQTKETREAVAALGLPGIFTNEKQPQRVYIQGSIAGQLLGFVNDAGEGQYGIEENLNDRLNGEPGLLRALTDQNNVPLLATGDNVQQDPVDGETVVLTIDVSMQRQIEAILEKGLKDAQSESGSLIVLDANSGAVRAMANYPSYDPAAFTKVEDAALFQNAAVSSPLEPGSIMKTLTVAAALDSGSVTPDQSYFDPGFFTVDGATVRNVVESSGSGTRTLADILRLSLNTGATWLLRQMGGGELNQQGRETWHRYMTEHYQLGKRTGIEQGPPNEELGTEAQGIIPDPTDGYGLNIRFANTSFGQGMTATPLQMAAAVTAAVNGGTYYRPTLVAGTIDADGNFSEKQPDIVKNDVVSDDVSAELRRLMENVVANNNRTVLREGFQIGGKTGTAEIANPAGGYYEDRYNGTYVGFVGGDTPEYVVIVRANEPKAPGYAGSIAGRPIFTATANALLDNFNVSRKSN